MYANTAIYNSYLTGLEREYTIEDARIENELSKYNMLFEMVDIRLNQNIKDAELKVFSESGTYDDFTYLCEEAEAEAGQQKLNIIQKIFDVISRIFNTIGETIKKIFNIKGNPDDEIDIDEDLIKDYNSLAQGENSWSKIKNSWMDLRNGDFTKSEFLKNLVSALKYPVLIIAGGASAAVVTSKIVKKKRGDIEGMPKFLQTIVNDCKNIFDTIKNKVNQVAANNKDKPFVSAGLEIVKTAINGFQTKILNPIKNLITKIGNALGLKVEEKSKKEKNKEAKEKAKADKKAAKEAAKNNNQQTQPNQNSANQNQQSNGTQVAESAVFGINFDGFMESSIPDDDEINDLADMFNNL